MDIIKLKDTDGNACYPLAHAKGVMCDPNTTLEAKLAAILTAIDLVKDDIPDVDTEMSETSENPAQNKVITGALQDVVSAVKSVSLESAVNLVDTSTNTITIGEANGITVEDLGDGSFKFSGTSTSDTDLTYEISDLVNPPIKGKTLLFLGLPYDLENNNVVFGLLLSGDGGGGVTALTKKEGLRIEMTAPNYTHMGVVVTVKAGATIPDGFVVKPMVTTNLNATIDDFVPYTGITGKINSDLAKVVKDLGDASTLLTDEKVIVKAINELRTQFVQLKTLVTDLSNRVTALESKEG